MRRLVHVDHMDDFNKSKGLQDIVMSRGTYELLVAEYDAELEYRDNLHQVDHGCEYGLGNGSKLFLYSSNHMLGACQVMLELPDGLRVGYSGDFGWPIDEIIKVDQLVVDSTYGSPQSVRYYDQAEAEERLLEIVNRRLRHGPVQIYAHRGTIERVVRVICGEINVPIIATERRLQEIKVYQKHGLASAPLIALGSDEGQRALTEHSYVRLYAKGDRNKNEPMPGTTVTCSAYMTVGSDSPVRQISDTNYCVGLSNHADFNETIEYIRATGATMVVTDNTRNHGCELALSIGEYLPSVKAIPSTNKPAYRRD